MLTIALAIAAVAVASAKTIVVFSDTLTDPGISELTTGTANPQFMRNIGLHAFTGPYFDPTDPFKVVTVTPPAIPLPPGAPVESIPGFSEGRFSNGATWPQYIRGYNHTVCDYAKGGALVDVDEASNSTNIYIALGVLDPAIHESLGFPETSFHAQIDAFLADTECNSDPSETVVFLDPGVNDLLLKFSRDVQGQFNASTDMSRVLREFNELLVDLQREEVKMIVKLLEAGIPVEQIYLKNAQDLVDTSPLFKYTNEDEKLLMREVFTNLNIHKKRLENTYLLAIHIAFLPGYTYFDALRLGVGGWGSCSVQGLDFFTKSQELATQFPEPHNACLPLYPRIGLQVDPFPHCSLTPFPESAFAWYGTSDPSTNMHALYANWLNSVFTA